MWGTDIRIDFCTISVYKSATWRRCVRIVRQGGSALYGRFFIDCTKGRAANIASPRYLKVTTTMDKFESAQVLPALKPHSAADGRPVAETDSDCVERPTRKKRIPRGNRNPCVPRNWQKLKAANDNKPIDLGRFDPTRNWQPKEIPAAANDNARAPSEHRAIVDAWSAAHPETDSQIIPKASRNIASLLSDSEAAALHRYIELRGSNEPLQSSASRDIAERPAKRSHDTDSLDSLIEACRDGVEFKPRWDRIPIGGPPLCDCGYASAHAFYSYRERQVLVDGPDVERRPISHDVIAGALKYGAANDDSLAHLLNHTPEAVGATPNSIAEMRDAWPELKLDARTANEIKAHQRIRRKAESVLDYIASRMPVRRVGRLMVADREGLPSFLPDFRFGGVLSVDLPTTQGAIIGIGKRYPTGYIWWRNVTEKMTPPRDHGSLSDRWNVRPMTNDEKARGWEPPPDFKPYAPKLRPCPPSEWRAEAFGYTCGAKLVAPNSGTRAQPTDCDGDYEWASGWCYADEDDDDGPGTTPLDVILRREKLDDFHEKLTPESRRTLDLLLGLDGMPAQTLKDIGRAYTRKREPSDRTLEKNGLRAVRRAVADIEQIQRLAA